jgi:DHA1 family bicyclomycin/chloramphenicol resistance-like MFS transporter
MNSAVPEPAPPPARHGWLTANLLAQLAFGLLAMTLCLPSMQEWPAIFGASQAAVQLTFSGYIAAYGGVQLLYGPWSDRVGRKPVLLFGLALAGAGSLLAAFAPNLTVLTLARVLQGAGCAAGMVVGRALVQDHFAGPDRTRMMAFVGMVMGLVPPGATLLGGQLHVRLGWQANFVLAAVLALGLFMAAWRGLPTRGPQHASTGAGGWRQLAAGYGQLLRMPAFVGYVIVLAMTAATFYAFLGGAPIVLAGYGVGPQEIGWYVMCPPISYIFGNLLTTKLVHRMGNRPMMVLGQALTVTGVATVLVLALAGVHHPLALALPLALLGLGHGLLVPTSLTGTVGLVPALAGSAAAVAGLMQQLSGATAGLLIGVVDRPNAVDLSLQMLAWALVGWAVQTLLHSWLLRQPRPPSASA